MRLLLGLVLIAAIFVLSPVRTDGPLTLLVQWLATRSSFAVPADDPIGAVVAGLAARDAAQRLGAGRTVEEPRTSPSHSRHPAPPPL